MQMPEKANPTENNQVQAADTDNKIQLEKEWLVENRNAIMSYNMFVELHGSFADGLRFF